MGKILVKYKNMGVQAKAAIWFTFCSILQKGISMITVPIFTRLLTTNEYGIYSIYLSWLNILTVFTSLNLYYGVFNNAMLKYEDDRDRYTSSMQGLVIILTSGVFVVYLLGHSLFNNLLGLSTVFVILMFVEMLVSPALQFWSARQRFDYKYKSLIAVTLAKSLLNPVIGVIAVLLSRDRALARVVSVVFIEVLFCGSIMIYQFIKGKSFYVKEYWKYALGFNLPLIPHYLSGSILNQGDRVMIDNTVGKSAVGIYSVAYNVGMLMQIFTNAINSAFTPWMYTSLRDKKYKEIKRVASLLLLLMAGLVWMLMAFAPEVVRVFASEAYYEAIYVIPPIAASVFFIFMYILFSNLEFYYEKNKFIMLASIGAAVLNIILNAIFIPVFGYLAAGYTTLASYVIYCFSHYLFCRLICKEKLKGDMLYDSKFIFVLSVIVIVSTIFFTTLYRLFAVRYLLLVVLVGIIIAKRNYLIEQFKILKEKE